MTDQLPDYETIEKRQDYRKFLPFVSMSDFQDTVDDVDTLLAHCKRRDAEVAELKTASDGALDRPNGMCNHCIDILSLPVS